MYSMHTAIVTMADTLTQWFGDCQSYSGFQSDSLTKHGTTGQPSQHDVSLLFL